MKLLTKEELKILIKRTEAIKHSLNSIGHTFQDVLDKNGKKHLEECIEHYYIFLERLKLLKTAEERKE